MDMTSLGVCVDGVEGAELGDGPPAVFPVPELLAGPDEETGCFRFRPVWGFDTWSALKEVGMLPSTVPLPGMDFSCGGRSGFEF